MPPFARCGRTWPVQVTSPRLGFRDYLARYAHETLSAHDIISIMVGDLQRLQVYPERGYQIPQEIPEDVWAAFEALVAAGYDGHLVR